MTHSALPSNRDTHKVHSSHEDEDAEDQDFQQEGVGRRPEDAGSSDESDSDDEEAGVGPIRKRDEELKDIEADELKGLREDAEQGGAAESNLGRGKRRKVAQDEEASAASISLASSKEQEDAAWAAFEASGNEAAKSEASELVRVVEKYKFANDEVVKERLLPADHPDAIAYLKKQVKQKSDALPSSGLASNTDGSEAAGTSAPAKVSPPSTSAPPKPSGPSLRKKKVSKLASMAASGEPLKKMNTLEKSKMDWDSWKGAPPSTSSAGAAGNAARLTDQEREEMERQTKTGSGTGSMAGYLGRKDFLERVHERTDQ